MFVKMFVEKELLLYSLGTKDSFPRGKVVRVWIGPPISI